MKIPKSAVFLLVAVLLTGCTQTAPVPKESPAAKKPQAPRDAVESLAARLRQGSVADKVQAARSLAEQGGESVAPLAAALEDEHWEVRHAAAGALHGLGPTAKPAVPALTKALEAWVPRLKSEGRFTVRKRSGFTQAVWITPRDADLFACQEVVFALGKIGPDAADAIPALSELLQEDYLTIGDNAVEALGKMGPKAVPALIKAYVRTVENESSIIERDKLEKLIAQGGTAATPHLAKAIADAKSNEVRLALMRQLLRNGGGVPLLMDLLADKDRVVASEAAELLGWTGNSKLVIPVLIAALKRELSRDPKEFGKDAELRSPRLEPELEKPSKKSNGEDTPLAEVRAVSLRELLLVSLGRHGPGAFEAIPLMTQALKDQDADVRAAASWALKRMDSEKK